MRMLTLLPLFVVVWSLSATAFAQQEGERIFVTADEAPLRSQDATTGTVSKGNVLVVRNVNRDRFWVTYSSGSQTVSGWIDRSDVIPFSQALGFFSEDLKRNPTPTAYVARAVIWEDKGDYDAAIADFNEAIRLDPTFKWAYNNRGFAWKQKNDYDRAISDFNTAIHLDPKDAMPYMNRANAWSHKKQYDKAMSDYDEAIRLDPKFPQPYNNRGTLWNAKGKYERAMSDFNEAIRLDPKYESPYINRGDTWQAKREYDKAISDYSEAIRLDPKDARPHRGRGNSWSLKKVFDKAVADFSEAIRLDPIDVYSWNGRSWLEATCPDARYRDGKQAVEDATKACELTSWKQANNLDTLAAAYAEAGDFDAAVKWQTKAVELASERLKAELRSHVDLYKAHKPYREEPKK